MRRSPESVWFWFSMAAAAVNVREGSGEVAAALCLFVLAPEAEEASQSRVARNPGCTLSQVTKFTKKHQSLK